MSVEKRLREIAKPGKLRRHNEVGGDIAIALAKVALAAKLRHDFERDQKWSRAAMAIDQFNKAWADLEKAMGESDD